MLSEAFVANRCAYCCRESEFGLCGGLSVEQNKNEFVGVCVCMREREREREKERARERERARNEC